MTVTATRPPRSNHPAPRALDACEQGTGLPVVGNRRDVTVGLLRAARPHQWVKNATVLMVPALVVSSLGVAGVVSALVAAMAFCLASSSVYLLNDTIDREADRHHPVKRNRPIASGVVSLALAVGASTAAALTAVGLGLLVTPILGGVVAGYLLLSATYSLGLKRLAWLDVALLAGGFMLRVIAGAAAVAVGVPALLLVAVFAAAAFVALGKRRSELVMLGEQAEAHRSALAAYRLGTIDAALCWTQAAAVVAFGLWVLSIEGGSTGTGLGLLGAVGLLGVLDAYRQRLLRGGGGDPTRELLANHALMPGLVVAGLVVLAAGIV